jgi:predicted ATPase
MAIEALRIKNYKVFKDVSIENIPPMSVFIGANGTGKSTLLDVFKFLQDALATNVTKALTKRGGFRQVVSKGESGPIALEIGFKDFNNNFCEYKLEIELINKEIFVKKEILEMFDDSTKQEILILNFENGKGSIIESKDKSEIKQLKNPDMLALKKFSSFIDCAGPRTLNMLIGKMIFEDIQLRKPYKLDDSIPEHYLLPQGENLPLYAEHLQREYPEEFKKVINSFKRHISSIISVEVERGFEKGSIYLLFQEKGFKEPFLPNQISDGTLRLFAYLLMLHDPDPKTLCVEEPEKHFYHQLLWELAEEFSDYAYRGGQVFVTTQSPEFLNGVRLERIFFLEKEGGFTTICRGSDSALLKGLLEDGELAGVLWNRGLFKSEFVA